MIQLIICIILTHIIDYISLLFKLNEKMKTLIKVVL